MQKPYFNDAVAGNSSMLVTFSRKAELLRLFWPHIDYFQQFDRLLCGIFIKNKSGSTVWLNDDRCLHQQEYFPDTNIVVSTITNRSDGYKAVIYDFVQPERDVLVRRFEIENLMPGQTELGFVSFSAASGHEAGAASTLFDFREEALIHYRSNSYVAVFSDMPAMGFQIGNNSYDAAVNTYLFGKDDIGMAQDGALAWDLGLFEENETKYFNLYIAASETLKGCKSLVGETRGTGAEKLLGGTCRYWKQFLENSEVLHTGNTVLDELYKRSLLVFKLMYDKKSGGLLAAPEVDENFTRCGRYAYCWGRDAAFIAGALDIAGMEGCVDNFYKWAVKVQESDGSWQQRYHMDGNLGPCWGLQIDETGSILWGMLRHYRHAGDLEFLRYVWESVEAAANFLTGAIDGETGLPRPSFDLWEERLGEHAYSSAAVYAGLRSAAGIAGLLGKSGDLCRRWDTAADNIKQAIIKHFWKGDFRRFIRSIRVKLNGFGQEPPGDTASIEVNPKGYRRDFTLEDWTVDVSMLGLAVPFEVIDVSDPMMKDTVALIEQVLTSPAAGGIKRYENDEYIGGNPWILTTLWVALYHVKAGNPARAREYLLWASRGRTDMGLLPEQVNKETGRPDWVIPLTWSHAMYVHVLSELVNAGML